MIEAATETRGSCPGFKRSPHTSRQPGNEGDAFLKPHAALAARAGFPERAWEVCTAQRLEIGLFSVFCALSEIGFQSTKNGPAENAVYVGYIIGMPAEGYLHTPTETQSPSG